MTETAGVRFASPRRLMWWRFRKHRLAVVCLGIMAIAYVGAATCEFWAPTTQNAYHSTYAYAPPQRIHLGFDGGPHLYVHGYRSEADPATMERRFTVDESQRIPLRVLAAGEEYKLFGVIPFDRHLLAPVRAGDPFYPLGADKQGRDLATRLLFGARISLSVGLFGVIVGLVLGVLLGGISGYLGGAPDTIIQRAIEFIMSIPTLPLWLGLAAAVPPGWGPVKTYFAITLILSLIGWTGLARVIRGKFLELRTEDYVLAAELDGAGRSRIILRHLLPGMTSYIITTLTLAVPSVILAETALSFLGLGLVPPAVSWGVLLQDAQNIRVLASAPWLLLPGAAVVVTVIALNFVGDGLRDAADPHGS